MNDDPTPTPADRAINWTDVLRVCAAATPGPWTYNRGPMGNFPKCVAVISGAQGNVWANDRSPGQMVAVAPNTYRLLDAEFIALARTALPAAARLILELRAENDELADERERVANLLIQEEELAKRLQAENERLRQLCANEYDGA